MDAGGARRRPVLVTGGAGFVGACLVRRLVDEGLAVHLLLREPQRAWRLRDILPRVRVHRADLRDAGAVDDALQASRPEVVYHLAAYGAYESQSDARIILETNVLGTSNLLSAGAAAGVELLVSTGSSSEYGFKSEAMRETDRLEPNSDYAVAKAAQTHLCQLQARRGSMAVTALRLFSVFGPWEEPSRLMPTLVSRAMAGLPLEMVAPQIARDFVYVDDVLDLLLDVERLRAASGEVFNVGSGVQTTLGALVALACRTLGSRSEVHWGAMRARQWDSCCWVADVAKTRRQLGWSPRVTLAEGILRMAQWIETRRDEDASLAAA